LRPEDSFQMIRFSDDAAAMTSSPVSATRANIESAIRWVDNLEAEGGTQMMKGLQLAFGTDVERYRIIALMTDGLIGNDRDLIDAVKRGIGSARLFTFGIGMAPNGYLVEGAARLGRGASCSIGNDESSRAHVDAFFRRIEHPALTDIKIDWGDMDVTDVHPDPIPDLFVGRPVVLTGRFSGSGKATVRVADQTIEVDLEDSGRRHRAIAPIWARAKIESLCDAGAPEDPIRALALQYGLMSPFTAFLAVDSSQRTQGDHGTTVTVPVPSPKGVKYETKQP